MLKKITDLLEDTNCFVCVLISELSGSSSVCFSLYFLFQITDEVESLAAAHTQLQWMEMSPLVQSGFQMSVNKTDLSWIGSACNDFAGSECIPHSTWHSEVDTNVLVITTSNPPGGACEQNPTIQNHWEKIMWTSKFFRHGICRSGGFQTESWKPWSESAVRYRSVLSLWTNPHKHHHKPVGVSWTVFQPATLFSSLLDLIFPNRIYQRITDNPLDLTSVAGLFFLLLVPLKRPQEVLERHKQVFCFCLFAMKPMPFITLLIVTSTWFKS